MIDIITFLLLLVDVRTGHTVTHASVSLLQKYPAARTGGLVFIRGGVVDQIWPKPV